MALAEFMRGAVGSADVLVHLGAGRCRELADYRELREGRDIVLVEANPRLSRLLKAREADIPGLAVLECAVAGESGPRSLRVYNLEDRASLHTARGLRELYPGLRLQEEIPVEARAADRLIAEIDPEGKRSLCLVIDTPGEELPILQSLVESGRIRSCRNLILHCSPRALYESAATADELGNYLEANGYDLTASHEQEDPEFLTLALTRNAWKLECESLRQQLRLERERAETDKHRLAARLAEAQAAHEKELVEAKAVRDELQCKLQAAQSELTQNQTEQSEEWQRHEQELTQARQKTAEMGKELEGVRKALETTRAEQVKQAELASKQEQALNESRRRVAELEEKRKSIQSELEQSRATHAEQVQHLKQLHDEEIQRLEQLLAEARQQTEQYREDRDRTTENFAQLEKKFREIQEKQQSMETELESSQQENARLATELQKLQSEKQQLEQRAAEYQQKNRQSETRIRILQDEIAKAEGQIDIIKSLFLRNEPA